jgi:hypothetical protein
VLEQTPLKILVFLSLGRNKTKTALYKSCSCLTQDSASTQQTTAPGAAKMAPEPVHTLFPAQAGFSKAISNR